ncbi:DUF5518 domain-containing protein [Natrarchaeobius chitinivorans]|uniref:DUF5518 domain-containing protein n=1 Tax=Natrarchaeobius chitinivorans TaxID=1679083 RepID=UPI001404C5FF
MSVLTPVSQWLLDKDLRVATALGFLTIPLTVAVSWNTLPSEYSATPVLVAGVLGGLYYSNQSRSTSSRQAGLRIGVISAFDSVILVGSAIASGWEISAFYATLGAGFGVLWFVFSLAVLCLISIFGALVGGIVGRIPPFRRGEPQTV